MKIWFCSQGGLRLASYEPRQINRPLRLGEGLAPMIEIDGLIFGVYNKNLHHFDVPNEVERILNLGIVSFNFIEIER